VTTRFPESARRHSGTLRQLGPGAAFYLVFFVAPLLILFVYSFWSKSGYDIVPDFKLSNYITGMTSGVYQSVFLRTVMVGFSTAWIVVPIAYVLAYVMRFILPRRAQLLLDVILVSMFCGYLVRIYAWRTILGKDGLLNAALMQIGLIDEPITFLIFSYWAVLITLVGLLIPLTLLPIYSSMANVSREHLEVARDLGAKRIRLHRTILVPMVLPGLSTGFAIAFILAAGDFVVPTMVGGTQGIMIGNIVADQFKGFAPNWPLGAALAFLTLAVVVTVYLVTTRLVRVVTRL
jgi:spermidine/putrescine transport system permease protein